MQQNDKQPKFKVILPEGFSLERHKQVISFTYLKMKKKLNK